MTVRSSSVNGSVCVRRSYASAGWRRSRLTIGGKPCHPPGHRRCHTREMQEAVSATMIGQQLTDAQVYEEHRDELVRFAMGLVGRSDAPDVVSEAVLRAWSAKAWPTVANKRAYLFRAVLNQARNSHRERQRRWARELKAAGGAYTELPDCRPEVLAAVKKLSLRQRAVVYLAYWDDLTADEIAGCLGISSGSVHRHLARARAKLRVMLDE